VLNAAAATTTTTTTTTTTITTTTITTTNTTTTTTTTTTTNNNNNNNNNNSILDFVDTKRRLAGRNINRKHLSPFPAVDLLFYSAFYKQAHGSLISMFYI
jgi:hypothetical protein